VACTKGDAPIFGELGRGAEVVVSMCLTRLFSLCPPTGRRSLFLAFLGHVIFALWFLAQGKTPGRCLVRVRVVDKRQGSIPGPGRMLVRGTVGKLVSGFFLGIGYFWAIFDRDGQAWHDKIAGTVVLRQPSRQATGAAKAFPAAVSPASPSPTGASAAALSRPPGPAVAPQGIAQFCSQCGERVEPGSQFCGSCGARL
jgi:uncharacterized RDD family membrane protein YckC